jgi:hypothetical protein
MFADIGRIMADLHDSEINGSVGWFYDGCWMVRLGDRFNGLKAETTVQNMEEAAEWLRANAVRLYPDSVFAGSYRRGFE